MTLTNCSTTSEVQEIEKIYIPVPGAPLPPDLVLSYIEDGPYYVIEEESLIALRDYLIDYSEYLDLMDAFEKAYKESFDK